MQYNFDFTKSAILVTKKVGGNIPDTVEDCNTNYV